MSIDPQQSISGFIATQPRLTVGENGVSRFHARVGIEHARQEPDGSFTQLDPTFHDLAIFRKTAEEAAARFRKGDRFIASGRVHEYTYSKDGQEVTAEEFIASRIGHDLARTRYDVDRSTRRTDAGHDAPDLKSPAHDPVARPQASVPSRASL
ncbi:single-stranded DNA-binding protein [Leucobacter aridicollis]|uniref:Single-stranded DNA-binding protein n=1 Tax=Leucobacter aridicollis TaxID=283878 RepID=A0A852R5K0_9MICO|nr:single-stranded DNA-binding protein [Leucobacter aridicollis]MBL3682323.1 single-stranded DNA-binding protein [Leucobacter aridicollis]NYD25739.1 single-stranded DNA-binding protein [Leucobacter aridicollis]